MCLCITICTNLFEWKAYINFERCQTKWKRNCNDLPIWKQGWWVSISKVALIVKRTSASISFCMDTSDEWLSFLVFVWIVELSFVVDEIAAAVVTSVVSVSLLVVASVNSFSLFVVASIDSLYFLVHTSIVTWYFFVGVINSPKLAAVSFYIGINHFINIKFVSWFSTSFA